MRPLAGRCVWLTGASSGIGRATTLQLLKAGATVVASARRRERLEALREACPDSGRLHVVPMDVTRDDSRSQAWRDVRERGLDLDVLLHCAGIGQSATVSDTALDVDRRIMEVNYFAPVALTKLCLPALQQRGRGHVVVVSSIQAYFAPPRRAAYAASKHALHGFFDALRAETARHGIDVSLVCPGWVASEFRKHALDGDGGNDAGATPRGIDPARCAQTIVQVVQRPQREVYVGGPEVLSVYAQRFVPGVLARLARHWR